MAVQNQNGNRKKRNQEKKSLFNVHTEKIYKANLSIVLEPKIANVNIKEFLFLTYTVCYSLYIYYVYVTLNKTLIAI